ncbi:MAG TPA: hypothetical protein VFO01_02365 [Trebonia sp.]|nr:hypothetical protein [Trebonia sp.]
MVAGGAVDDHAAHAQAAGEGERDVQVLAEDAGPGAPIPPADLYAAQVTAFSAAVAGAATWQGATLADGVRVPELLGAAWDFTRNRARA